MTDAPINYSANSNKSKKPAETPEEKVEERPKLTPVVPEGSAKFKKKGLGKKFAETFTGEDAKNVVQFVAVDVIVPALKNLAADTATSFVERLLFGNVQGRTRLPNRGGPTLINYSAMSKQNSTIPREGNRRPELSRQARASHNFDDIIMDDRGQAEEVLSQLRNYLLQYDVVSVNELYDLVGITGSHTDLKYGWYDLSESRAIPIRGGGYLLDLPRPEPLN
jgi:hypothetical protein